MKLANAHENVGRVTNAQTADCFTAACHLLRTSAASYTSNKTKITIKLNTGLQPGDDKHS